MDLPSIIVAIGGSGGVLAAVWAFVKERIEKRDIARKEESDAIERRISNAEKLAQDSVSREITTFEIRVKKLEKDHADCESLLRTEMRRSATNALEPRRADDPIPDQLPPPKEEWYDEHTGARIMWDEETQKVIRAAKERRRRERDPKQLAAPRVEDPHEDRRPRAIIVDDEVLYAQVLTRVLATIVPSDWKVEMLTDARAGRVVLIMDARVRFAIVDYLMPRFDGEAIIADTLKQRPELRGKIIVMSGWALPKDVATHLFDKLGCLWLKKPIDPVQLRQLVEQVIAD